MIYKPNPYNQSAEVETKATRSNKPWTPPRYNMSISDALSEFGSYQWKEGISLAEVFLAGIAYAEEYHKIGPNENGDYK